MRILTWGDLHGHDVWKKTDPERYERIIFLGDYVDSFFLDDQTIVRNFREVIEFKKQFSGKVVLLIGNHEISYLLPDYRATGYRPSVAEEILTLFWENVGCFRMAYQYGSYLWTHAGIHQGWFDNKLKQRIESTDRNLADTLERLFIERYPPLFEIGWARGGAHYDVGGPFWLDHSLLVRKPLRGYHQIVGHNRVETIKQYTPYPNDPTTTVILCDTVERGDKSHFVLDVDEADPV